jgi:hypothetical protein
MHKGDGKFNRHSGGDKLIGNQHGAYHAIIVVEMA